MKRERKSRRVAGGDNTYVLCVPHIVHDRPVGSFRNVHAAQLHCDSCDCELDHNDGIIGKRIFCQRLLNTWFFQVTSKGGKYMRSI